MKKIILVCIAAAIALVVLCLGAGCTKAEIYTYSLQEGETKYTLTLNEGEKTFVLEEEKAGEKKEQAGTFFYKDGSVVLYNEEFGYRSVVLVGDGFLFISNPEGMAEIEPPCEHRWDNGMYTPGNCKTYGFSVYSCEKCGETKKVVDTDYGPHSLDGGRHYDGATCADRGYTVYTCKICRTYTEKEEDEKNSDSHHFEATETVRDNGCNAVMTRLHICSRCNEERYLAEDSRSIGAHKDENCDGICDVCGHLKNGLPSVHADKDEDGKCDTCAVKVSILEGIVRSPEGYEEDGKLYLGVYPQMGAVQTAKEIRANGLYDAELDCWYYAKETYVLRTVTSGLIGGTFVGGGQEIEQMEYAFLLQPLCFVKEGETDRYVCDRIIDAGAFQKSSAKITEGLSNLWQDSTLLKYLNEKMPKRMGLSGSIEIDLMSVEELSEEKENDIKKITDYAVAGGAQYTETDTGRVGRYYTKTSAEGTDDKVLCVGYRGDVEQTDVSFVRGIVPVITLKQGE